MKAFEHKKCLFCGSKQVKKNGTRDGKQRYKCTARNKRFSGGSRLDPDTLWQLYSDGKQTAAQLAEQHGCSLKTIRRHLAKTLAALLALPLTYLLAAWLLGSVVLTPEDTAGDDITVYLITNGVHTDLALPLKNDTFDWTKIINPGDTRAANRDWGYAAFGWGDRGFYVETPHWRDLKISTALTAVSGLGDSIIHVTYYPMLWESAHSIAIPMPRAHYRRLAESIRDQFALHESRAVVAAPAYGDNDIFYAARGHYSLFHTCNSWTNRRLSDAGLKHVLWTPFAHSLMRVYHP